MTTPNEIANEARNLANSPAPPPGAQPEPLIVAEVIRNLATLVAELAAHVEQVPSH